MQIEVFLENGAKMPTKAHSTDAGFDLYMPKDAKQTILMGYDSLTIDTGVHIDIPSGYVGMIKSKSGLNVKRGIRCEGVVDAGYTGSIVAKLYNDSRQDYRFAPGEKITQLVILPIPEVELVQVDGLQTDSDRGANGFGSSGKF